MTASDDAPTRVFVVDDHPIITVGLERFAAIEPTLEVVGSATTLEGLEERLRDETFDVLSLDVQVPGMNGPSTIRRFSRATARPILLFTLHEVDDALAALVHAGAAGYLSKSSSMDTYLEAVHALRRGERWLSSLLDRSASGEITSPLDQLTEREREVFDALADGHTIKEVAFALGLSASTVYNHFDKIRAKCGISSQAELVRLASRWRWDPS